MKKFNWLQMFAEGDGGDTGASATPAETEGATVEATTSGDSIDSEIEEQMRIARIPEREKETFKKAYKKTHKIAPKQEEPAPVAEDATESKPEHIPYAELIKGEYKDEHKAYMDKTIADRFKSIEQKNAQMQESNAKMQNTLNIIAQKYKLDPNAPDFIDRIANEVANDDEYVERAAFDANMSVPEFKRIKELERDLQVANDKKEQLERAQRMAEVDQKIHESAVRTKEMFPDFNLELELQDERFQKALWAADYDTTAAYHLLHWNQIMPRVVAKETAKATQKVTQSIASGQTRPKEASLSNNVSKVVNMPEPWRGKSSSEMEAWGRQNLR